jgi:hypothetical protein
MWSAAVTVERQPLWSNRKDDHGPFDIIGDVHGCCDELEDLLAQLGYVASSTVAVLGGRMPVYTHAEGRKAVFLASGTWSIAGRSALTPCAWCVPCRQTTPWVEGTLHFGERVRS